MTYIVLTQESYVTGTGSNPFVNVYTYETDVEILDTITLQTITEAFWDYWIAPNPGWGLAVHSSMVTTRLLARAPYNPESIGIFVGSEAGLQGGDATNNFLAVEFKQERQRADMRAGFKRFGRLSEGVLTAGQPIATYLAQLDTLADMLSANINVPVGAGEVNLSPIIVKRIKYTTPSGKDAYRLPEGLDPFESYRADSWAYRRITTQNSRKS